jgi:hypothetical protein
MIVLTAHCLFSLKLDELKIDYKVMHRFLKHIFSGYRRDVEYHNDLHGADVM